MVCNIVPAEVVPLPKDCMIDACSGGAEDAALLAQNLVTENPQIVARSCVFTEGKQYEVGVGAYPCSCGGVVECQTGEVCVVVGDVGTCGPLTTTQTVTSLTVTSTSTRTSSTSSTHTASSTTRSETRSSTTTLTTTSSSRTTTTTSRTTSMSSTSKTVTATGTSTTTASSSGTTTSITGSTTTRSSTSAPVKYDCLIHIIDNCHVLIHDLHNRDVIDGDRQHHHLYVDAIVNLSDCHVEHEYVSNRNIDNFGDTEQQFYDVHHQLDCHRHHVLNRLFIDISLNDRFVHDGNVHNVNQHHPYLDYKLQFFFFLHHDVNDCHNDAYLEHSHYDVTDLDIHNYDVKRDADHHEHILNINDVEQHDRVYHDRHIYLHHINFHHPDSDVHNIHDVNFQHHNGYHEHHRHQLHKHDGDLNIADVLQLLFIHDHVHKPHLNLQDIDIFHKDDTHTDADWNLQYGYKLQQHCDNLDCVNKRQLDIQQLHNINNSNNNIHKQRHLDQHLCNVNRNNNHRHFVKHDHWNNHDHCIHHLYKLHDLDIAH
ncbi:hypothetical protein AK812_SmicGene33319 [Symbiodinium microadriaticum]|uniref:Uncharacterized protein n=1 Tax=Symbiodinium microadriaticum TaxID=2951 RepID=A0A1Q9CRY3_SYMMI|nr:hypothetical protein AK812_SmicGene33319 [Symbiodinium microadriaticum]